MKKQLIFLLLFPLFSLAQIKGQIVDSNNSPLEYATAALFKQADSTLISGVITDQKGNFNLKSPENGSYFLEASFIGYETKTLNGIVVTRYYIGVISRKAIQHIQPYRMLSNKKTFYSIQDIIHFLIGLKTIDICYRKATHINPIFLNRDMRIR